MRKKILCLALIAVMVLGTSMNVVARDLQGSDNWLVNFDGNELDSNYTSQNVADDLKDFAPGDNITLKVNVKNSFAGDTDWYMTNEVIQSLEDASSASGAAYTYRLTYVAPDNAETVLYDSDTVGGEGSTQAGEGLHQATGSLKDYIYMGRLSQGKSGRVQLYIALDGETSANDYQETLGKIQLKFAVEKVAAGTTTTQNRIVQSVVKTGDDTRLMLISIILLISGIVVLILGIVTWKRQRKHREEGE
ncbi:MAG: hypothetical protein PHQ72_01320 [Hespellia sp.]|nr:hypothetical protein [Hespellia sp.]